MSLFMFRHDQDYHLFRKIAKAILVFGNKGESVVFIVANWFLSSVYFHVKPE